MPPRRGTTIPLSVAPMMDRTDRHYRFLMRLISQRALLYTEMVTTGAILNGDPDHLLGYSPQERPLSLQLGGDDPDELARCARLAEERDYDEVNLNIGCPSDRVQRGHFGVCLMADPERVADGVRAMREAVKIPVTVKHRIGFDDRDAYEDMLGFVDVVAAAGADRFTVHARKAWLQGLSPKQNRTVPPLRYEEVYRLKRDRPDLPIEINGGIRSLDEVAAHLERVDAVMIGRWAYDDPYGFAAADARFFEAGEPPPSREDVARGMIAYARAQTATGERLGWISRHMLNLFCGQPGARRWRRALTEAAQRPDAEPDAIEAALEGVLARAG